jgi:hypothetical protein
MPIIVQWDDDAHTIIRYIYSPGWTWAEYEVAVNRAHALVNAEPPTARLPDVIADFTTSSLLPANALTNFRRSFASTNALDFGVAVLVMRSQFMRQMFNMYLRLNAHMAARLRAVATLAEARALIAALHPQPAPTS